MHILIRLQEKVDKSGIHACILIEWLFFKNIFVWAEFRFFREVNAMLGEIWLNNPPQKHVTTQRENKIDSLRGLPLNYTS